MTLTRSTSACVALVPLVLLSLPGTGCSTVNDGLRNLDDLHVEVEDGSMAYAETIPRRSWWWRFKRNTLATVGLSPPSLEARIEVDDPIECALENLELIDDEQDELEGVDRWVAVVLVSEWARRDRARVVRTAAYRTLWRLIEEDEEGFAFDPTASPEEDVASALDNVGWLVQADAEVVAAEIEARWPALRRGAAQLLLVRGDRVAVSERLGKLASLAAQRTAAWDIQHEFEAAARVQALRCAFQSCEFGLTETTEEVQSAALTTLFRLDPRQAADSVARAYDRLFAPVVKVRLLRAMLDGELRATDLSPELRRLLSRELEALDSAVSYWATQLLATMLDVPGTLPTEELRARWDAFEDPSRAGGA